MKKTIIKSWLTLLAICAFDLTVSAESLDLSEGTLSLGGNVAFNLDGELSGTKKMEYNIGARLPIEYFLLDNFSLTLDLGALFNFGGGDAEKNSALAGLSVAYYFDSGSSFTPYLGAGVLSRWSLGTTKAMFLDVPVKLGFLLAMNSSVAIDFGVMAKLGIPVSGGQADVSKPIAISAGVGYLGLRGYF